jgi:hypothetical protein
VVQHTGDGYLHERFWLIIRVLWANVAEMLHSPPSSDRLQQCKWSDWDKIQNFINLGNPARKP